MASLTEILILRGVMPIESLDSMPGGWGEEEVSVRALIDPGVLTEAQVASARAAQAGLPCGFNCAAAAAKVFIPALIGSTG